MTGSPCFISLDKKISFSDKNKSEQGEKTEEKKTKERNCEVTVGRYDEGWRKMDAYKGYR